MRRSRHGRRLCTGGSPTTRWVWLCAGLGLGCLPADDPSERVESAQAAPLLGARPANDPSLDAIGSIVLTAVDETTKRASTRFSCTGTLIGPSAVLTARSCADAAARASGKTALSYFAIGPDALNPIETSEIVDAELHPSLDWQDGPRVGVLFLRHPVTHARPLPLGPKDDLAVGQTISLVGYGALDLGIGTRGIRRIGDARIFAMRGALNELRYGSFDAFHRARFGRPPPEDCDTPAPADGFRCSELEDARAWFASHRLEATEEIMLLAAPGAAQPCDGDDGGPFLRTTERGVTVYGLNTYVLDSGDGSKGARCDSGALYGVFSAALLSQLTEASRWVDPCASLTEVGACHGTIARRCTSAGERPRRRLEIDCSLVGMTCMRSKDGRVGCDHGPGVPN